MGLRMVEMLRFSATNCKQLDRLRALCLGFDSWPGVPSLLFWASLGLAVQGFRGSFDQEKGWPVPTRRDCI